MGSFANYGDGVAHVAHERAMSRPVREMEFTGGMESWPEDAELAPFTGRSGPVFDPFAFAGGASIGDGATVATPALQAAIDAAVAAGGGIVAVPKAEYNLAADTLVVGTGVRFIVAPGATFTTPATRSALPSSFFNVVGNDVVLDGIVMTLGSAGNSSPNSSKGVCITIAGGVSNAEILRCDLRYFFHGIGARGRWSDINIHHNKFLCARVDIAIQGPGVFGSGLKIWRNRFLGNRTWIVPLGPAGLIHIAGGVVFYENAGITDAIFDTQYNSDIEISNNYFGSVEGRPVAVVNARNCHTHHNFFDQLVGTYTKAGVSDDVLTCDLIRGGSANDNIFHGGGENGIDVLSCTDFRVRNNTIRKMNSAGIGIYRSDQYAGAPSTAFSKTNLACRNITIEGNSIEAFWHISVGLGTGIIIGSNTLIPYPASTHFASVRSPYLPWTCVLFRAIVPDLFVVAGQGFAVGSTSATALRTSIGDLANLGVTVGMVVRNVTTGATMTIISLSRTTSTNDTMNGKLSSGSWTEGDRFEVAALATPSLKWKDIHVKGNLIEFGPRVEVSASVATNEFTSVGPHGFTSGEAIEFEVGGDVHSVLLPTGPATGTASGAVNTATVLTDASGDFVNRGVQAGDRVLNTTNAASGIVTAVTATSLTMARGLVSDNTGEAIKWNSGDRYRVLLHHTRTYFVISSGITTFKLATTFTNAVAGIAIRLSHAGGGPGQVIYVARTNINRLWIDGLHFPYMSHVESISGDAVISAQMDFLFSAMTQTTNFNLGQGRTIEYWYALDPYVDYFPGNQRGNKRFIAKWWKLPPFYSDGANTYGVRTTYDSLYETFFSPGERIHTHTSVPTDGTIRAVVY